MRHDIHQLPRVQALHAVIDKLPTGKQSFARSLEDNFRKWGKLSPAQMEWVEKLIVLATAPEATQEPKGHETIPSTHAHAQKIPGFACVEKLLYTAADKVEFPCIRLQTVKGQKIELRPRKAERAVTVHVGNVRGVCRNEVLDTSYLRYLADLTDVLNTLYEMAARPIETAILYGKKYKSCCFCGLGLTNPASLHAGYGPICAENYSLPWGDKGPAVTAEEMGRLLDAQEGK